MTGRPGLSLVVVIACVQLAHASQPPRPVTSHADAALIANARQYPDTVRESISRAFASIASANASRERDASLLRAQHLADAYAQAWSDSFFVRQLSRFAKMSRADQRSKVIADSLRLAGVAVIGSEGAPAAMKLWRESLSRASSIKDDAGIAVATMSIGAGFYRLEKLDSAEAYLNKARDLAQRVGDFRTVGNATGILASVSKSRGNVRRATDLYRRASIIRARSGDTRGIAADENNLGLIAEDAGDIDAARRAFSKALDLNRRDGRKSLVALNLGNLAGIASASGEYGLADSLYRQALVADRETGNEAESGFVLHNLGRLLISRGDYRQALNVLTQALRIHEKSGALDDATNVRIDLAAVESATGDPDAALTTLSQAERAVASRPGTEALRGGLALTRADVLTQFGTFADADADYRRAEQLYAAAGQDAGRVQALQGRALLLHLRGDESNAQRLLNQVERALATTADKRSAAITALLRADVQRVTGDYVRAEKTLNTAQQRFHSINDVIGEAAAVTALGDLALMRASPARAEMFYRRGLAQLGNNPAPELTWRLHAGLGEALRARGATGAAATEFRLAIAGIERTASRVRLDERRSGFLSDKWNTYTQLALLEKSRGRAADAFAVSERMRARQMVDMLTRGQVTAPRGTSAKEHDLRRRIDDLTRKLEVIPTPADTREPHALSANETRRQLDAAQKEYVRVISQLSESDPAYARFVSGETLSSSAVGKRLSSDEVLLEYLLGDSSSIVFVVTSNQVVALDLHATREEISNLVEFARRTMDKPGNAKPQLWRIPLARLYSLLITPVEQAGYLKGKRAMIIVPHGELHFLSFGALMSPARDKHFLVEQFEISYTPSATTWARLGERPSHALSGKILAMAPKVDRLPASRDEVSAIKNIYGARATVLSGRDASEQNLRAKLRDNATLHLATFGVLNKHNPLFSFVELAPSNGANGRLEVNEVYGLGLSGQLVVLSACQTAVGSGALADVPPGDDWVGLVQAFLQGGARDVLASLWPVDDRATAQLMEEFHRRYSAGRTPASAIAEAQRVLLRRPNTASPFYWAGFVLNGSAGTQNRPRIAQR
ncbi:MAG TPA: CHAT domain-containing protein [Gemmatimonadaceae bacterium]|nr:CHAT domain-containing protein [Gemmatimonadaceae bacterium]